MSLLTTNVVGGFCFIKKQKQEVFNMKTFLLRAFTACTISITLGNAHACMSRTECSNGIGSRNCNCCSTGESEIKYTCPTGWTASGSTCYRSATKSSDSIGYTETTYGTCAGTKGGTVMCYEERCAASGKPKPACSLM